MSNKVLQKTVKISSKGQITIPKAFLESLGVDKNEYIILFSNDENSVKISSLKKQAKNILKNIYGTVSPKIKTNLSIEEQINESVTDFYNNKSSL
jgi:AbrB family looped-hinge helix DNA binding protein